MRLPTFADVRRAAKFSRFWAIIDRPCSWVFAQVGVKIGVNDQVYASEPHGIKNSQK
jgi:hypothetical protein